MDATINNDTEEVFNSIVMQRYACTRFHRHLEQASEPSNQPSAAISNPDIVRKAIQCIDFSRRAPSGFNAQPYRVIVVHKVIDKEALAQYCMGRNADRVRDCDCIMIFLADREVSRDWRRFGKFLKRGRQRRLDSTQEPMKADKKLEQSILKAQALVLLFSSGWPLPRILAAPLSFVVRLAVSLLSVITRRRVLVPSLASADTWASKNTMLVAMTFMLGCTARGLATCPMEGYNVGGIRKVLNIPKRFAIPLIVSTGVPYSSASQVNDDADMSHGPTSLAAGNTVATLRYPMEEVIFDSSFGSSISSTSVVVNDVP